MAVLITGASGFVGQVLVQKLLEKDKKVYGLSRHPPAPAKNLIPLVGDITESNLGLKEVPVDIYTVYHLAGIHSLGEDKDGAIWRTNVDGTRNVLEFCARYGIQHLYFTSTAYTQGRNTYERSKALCELLVKESEIPKVIIFKPSIIMGTEARPYPGHFSKFVSLLVKTHRRAEIIRRKIEGTLRLPILTPTFRVRGNPEGKLNLITVDRVAEAMAILEGPGTFWLTNPNPPRIRQLSEWIGEVIMVDLRIEPDFPPTPLEAMFQKMAAAFAPYLQGDDFPSDLQPCPITKEFIQETVKRTLIDLTRT